MKVYINKPRNHWLSPYTIAEKIVFWRRVDILDDPLVDKIRAQGGIALVIREDNLEQLKDKLQALKELG